MVSQQKTFSLRPWFIWGLAAFFFFSHYVVRVTPGQIIDELQATFADTSKYDIGILGASFYLPYVIMQMPVGYLVDRFGSRLLLTIAVLICSISCFIFAHSMVFSTAILSRVLLGFCSAAAFIGALKLITIWFEADKLALLVGITQALGMVGGATGSGLVPYLNDAFGWRHTFIMYSIVFFCLSILIFTVVRSYPKGQKPQPILSSSSSTKKINLSNVIFNKYTWINAFYAGLIFTPTEAMGELWGREFLKHIHHLEPHVASTSVSLLLIGWAIGGPCAGALADRVGRKPVMIGSAICGIILLPLIFYVPHLPVSVIMILLFLYGFTNTGLIASYASAGELHSKEQAGLSMAIANMFSVLVAASLMPLLGKLLEWNAASHSYAVGHHMELIYTSSDYKRATYVLPLCLFLAIICSFFVKETLPEYKK